MNRPTALLTVSLLATALTLVQASAASAQIAPSAKGPVDVTADQLEMKNQECLVSYRGDAEALQDTSRLRADVLNIYNRPMGKSASGGRTSQSCGPLERMEADGSVYYVTPTQVVKGDHAVYTAETKTIVVTGDVVATQGQNVVAGTKLVINTDTSQATMVSDVVGRGKSGRVRMVMYPNANSSGGAAAAPVKSTLRPPKPPPPRDHSRP